MRNKEICKSTNISRHSVSLPIIGDKNFESALEWHTLNFKQNSLEIGSRNLDRPIFKFQVWKKQLELQISQNLCSMTSAYLGKICVNFLSVSFRKYNKMQCFQLKTTIIRKSVHFCLKVILFVMLVDCPRQSV